MKQSIIKLICAGFFFMTSMTTTRCFAQEQETVWVKLLPEIPQELTEPSQRAEFIVLHFWDNFDFRDTAFLIKDSLLEHSFVDFIDLLSLVPDETRDKSIQSLLKKSEEERSMFSLLLKLSERYLYETASSLCDEEKFIPFLQYAIPSSLLDDVEKIRPDYLLGLLLKNRIGTVANDFTYTLMNGETGNLHAILSDYVLLYFNDPECEDCRMLIKQLIASPLVNQCLQSGKLKIITVYVNDDLDAWKKHAPDVLNTWIYTYDAEQKINMEGIYNIKQFPTLYLLDRDKKILLKDTSFENLEYYFYEHE